MADLRSTARPYAWMWPARHMEWLRAGLRAATDADARRLRRLPPIVGSQLLPAAAILLPLLVSLWQATTVPLFQGSPYEPWTLLIYDVFTESVPLMLGGLAIGLLSPAAGVLFVLAYAVGNIGATIATGELEPPLAALFGRLSSFLLLLLLVVDIPMVGRRAVEWWLRRPGGAVRRGVAIIAGSAIASGLVLAWSLTAGILIGTVFWLTGPFGAGPTARATNTLEVSPWVVVLPAASLIVALLALRFLRGDAPLAGNEPAEPKPTRKQRLVRGAVNLAFLLTLLAGTMSQIVDVVILGTGLLFGRSVAREILRRTGLAVPLARLSSPVRLMGAAVAAVGFSVAFIGIVGASDLSRWFNVVVAIVIAFVIVELFLEAEGVARELPARATGAARDEPPAVGTIVAGLAVMLQVASLFLPGVAAADYYGDQADTNWILAALAAAGASLACAAATAMQDPPPPLLYPGMPLPDGSVMDRNMKAYRPSREEWNRDFAPMFNPSWSTRAAKAASKAWSAAKRSLGESGAPVRQQRAVVGVRG